MITTFGGSRDLEKADGKLMKPNRSEGAGFDISSADFWPDANLRANR